MDNFLDNKIAEEEARQKKQTPNSNAAGRRTANASAGPAIRKPASRTDSPTAAGRSGAISGANDGAVEVTGQAPDPEDFVIGDDSNEPSRTATPRPVAEGNGDREKTDDAVKSRVEGSIVKGKEQTDEAELPEDVKRRLARLDHLTSKYHGLSYFRTNSFIRHDWC